MRFHCNHGAAICLSANNSSAVREATTFCNGLVFSEHPIKINQRVCLELGCLSSWSGGIRVGVTSTNPSQLLADELPRFVYPDLADRQGFWVRVLGESLTCTPECRLTVYLTSFGQLQLFINGQHKGALLLGLPTNQNLWLLLDVYGNTNKATFVQPDDVPKEIQARGPEVVEAYEQACVWGTQSVSRSRLMLVGQERVGKTSLKRSLLGQCHNELEEATDGIDLSASCSFSLNNRSSWKLSIKGDETVRREKLMDSVDLGVLGGVEGLEEEYNRAVASNIAQELMTHRQTNTDSSPAQTPGGGKDTGKTNPPANKTTSNQENGNKSDLLSEMKALPNMHKEVPDRVVDLVQEILRSKKQQDAEGGDDDAKNESGRAVSEERVVLNIWDFAGQSVYYTTHQVFLTHRAVYCIVFNLCDDLTAQPAEPAEKTPGKSSTMTTLQYMDFWMRSIHAHAAENSTNKVDNMQLSPPIFIVGTHRDSVHSDPEVRDQMVEEKFAMIREFVLGKPYVQHLVLPFYAVENAPESEEDPSIEELRREVERVAGQQPYVGEHMPLKWLRFEQDVTMQADAGVNFASFDQIYELAVNHRISGSAEVKALLQFYHDIGFLIYYGSQLTSDKVLSNTVVLNPQWLISMFHKVTASFPPKEQWNLLSDKWTQLIDQGILDESLLPVIWSGMSDHQPFLLALMSKFDLICPRLPPAGQTHRQTSKSFYVPMRFASYKDKRKVYAQTVHDALFYVDFNGFLPDGLFHRIQARVIGWSQEHGGRDLFLARGLARVFVDPDHDMLLEMCPSPLHRIKVLVMHVKDKEATSSKRSSSPSPQVVAKVRNFLESCLVDLRSMWMKRLSYNMCFPCPCGRLCQTHNQETCQLEDCMHFLDLDEALSNQVVCCEHRRVRTDAFKKWFPEPQQQEFKEPILSPVTIEQGRGNIERNIPHLPSWLKGAAKLLNGAPENQGWIALAQHMGYKQSRIDLLNEDLNPSLALLTDWIVSSGNTAMSVDVLLHHLQQLPAPDIVELITRAKETELERPQLFLSYQWDVQDEVSGLRDHLEHAGFSCWMDIGQMGGGDQLSAKIDQGIRNCKVVLACITPKYTASHLCNRELWLADLLHKPIIPVLMETVSWPPPGGMAVILSQLIYINMKGVGGHGGTGIHADLMDKYTEVVQRVSLHAEPDLTPCLDTTVVVPVEPPAHMSDHLSGYRTSMSSLSEVDFQRHSGHRDSSLDVMLSRYGDMPHDPSTYTTWSQANTRMSQRPAAHGNHVPQAHVKKCAVCQIL